MAATGFGPTAMIAAECLAQQDTTRDPWLRKSKMAGKIPELSDPTARGRSAAVLPSLTVALVAGMFGGVGCQPGSGDGAERSAPPARIVTADQESGGAPQEDARSGKVTIRVAGIDVLVEVADEPVERERGLMFRDSIPENEGMLFVYPQEQTLSFWMKNTPLPLDIAFVDAGGRIVDIQQMEPLTEQTYLSRRPAMYALEMRLGWFGDNEVDVGARVEF